MKSFRNFSVAQFPIYSSILLHDSIDVIYGLCFVILLDYCKLLFLVLSSYLLVLIFQRSVLSVSCVFTFKSANRREWSQGTSGPGYVVTFITDVLNLLFLRIKSI